MSNPNNTNNISNTNNTNNTNNICNNCGKHGHMFHQCKLPITSYGIILFRFNGDNIEYLMIRRKDSFGFIDFIRGKYIQYNLDHLQSMFNEMSILEKEKIRTNNFDTLWSEMWCELNVGSQYKNEEIISKKKFDSLKSGLLINDTLVDLEMLINNSTTNWVETEWEFPKGRRNHQERDLDCAKREFEEETGYSRDSIIIIDNVIPFEEIFIGSNHKSYKHKYFLAYMDKCINTSQYYQKSEVSKIEWKTLDKCLETIRPYNLEKKQLIININKALQEYRLY